MTHLFRVIVATALLFLSLFGCAGRGPKENTAQPAKVAVDAPPSSDNTPKWVTADCTQYFRTLGQKVLCGVGMSQGIRDPNLARNAAQARGRTEMARTIQVGVKSVLTDYQASGTDERGILKDEQSVESISREVSEVTLVGTRMVESWRSPDGAFYALMALTEGDFQTAVADTDRFDPAVREVVLSSAPKLFSAYDDETSAY